MVAASAGNHAQAVALAARREAGAGPSSSCRPRRRWRRWRRSSSTAARSAPSRVPTTRPSPRRAALAEPEGSPVVHPFDHPRVVAGQGTGGLEIARQAPALGLVVVPLGGGGLARGVGARPLGRLPGRAVVGVQAEACAPYVDALAAESPDRRPRAEHDLRRHRGQAARPTSRSRSCERHVDGIVSVLRRRGRAGDGPAPGALEAGRRRRGRRGPSRRCSPGRSSPPSNGETCVVLSGGNVDASRLAECHPAGGRRRPCGGSCCGRSCPTARARSPPCFASSRSTGATSST